MFILMQKIIFYAPHKSENRHGYDDDTDSAVDKPDAAHIEPRTHFVDDIRDEKPPAHRPDEYRKIPYNVMPQLRLGQEKVETGKQTYIQEQNKRIGEGEQEGGNEILRIGIDRRVGFADILRRVLPVEIEAEAHQHQAAQNLQYILIGFDKIDNNRHTQPCEQGIYQVGQRGSQPRNESRPTPLVERALDTQYPYRPHRCRYQYADGQSPNNRIER